MASLIKKKSKYSTYYVIAESGRVNGKPRIVKQWYLGTIEKLIAIAEGHPEREQPQQIDCLEEGSVAALFKIAEELGVRETVNMIVPKRKQGMSVGDYLLVAALNRALAASSKVKIREWVDQTALHLYLPLDRDKLDSQNFWDHFNLLDEATVERIGDALSRRAVEIEKLALDCLVYDTTNYYTYWDVLNPSELARMAHSKDGKHSLRHYGMALAVERDWGLPLFHWLYPANDHDSKVFGRLLGTMMEQLSATVSDKRGLTFVFDKGNNSEEAIACLDESRHHFVGCRSSYHHRDLCRLHLDRYTPQEIPDHEEAVLPVHETREELYGKMRRVLVVYNEATCHRQIHRMERNLESAKRELSFFKKKAKSADGRSTLDSINRQAQEIVDHYHVHALLDIDVAEEQEGYRVSTRKNFPAIEDLKTRFGKQILFTNRETLSAAEIVKIYLDRAIVEDAFRMTKSDHWVKMTPAFHWTDSKIRVHALTCVIALLLVRIAHKRARERGFVHGASRMLELLRGVRSAMMFYPKSSKPMRQVCHLSEDQEVLLKALSVDLSKRM